MLCEIMVLWGLSRWNGFEKISHDRLNMINFLFYLFLLFIAPVMVVGLVLVVINHYRNNRKYLEFEEEVYEGQEAETDMPKEPYE